MKNKTTFTLLLSALILSACTSVPKTELHNLPSLIEIVALNLTDSNLKIRVSHRNRLTRETNQLSCQLAIKDQPAIEFSGIPIPDLTTYAVETIEIDLADQPLPFKQKNHRELPYALDCFLFSENFRKEHLVNKDILYQVPGTTGEYR